jgi:hypothetical protein
VEQRGEGGAAEGVLEGSDMDGERVQTPPKEGAGEVRDGAVAPDCTKAR